MVASPSSSRVPRSGIAAAEATQNAQTAKPTAKAATTPRRLFTGIPLPIARPAREALIEERI
jgi:hypothetical protein